MPKTIEEILALVESGEQLDELSKKTLASYVKKSTRSADKAWDKGSKEEDKAMSTDGNKYPDKQARHNAAAADAINTWRKRDKGLTAAKKKLAKESIITDEDVAEIVESILEGTAAADSLKPGSKSQLMSNMVGIAGEVDYSTLTKMYDAMMQLSKKHGDNVPDGAAAKNKASVNTKGDATKTIVKEASVEIFGENEDLTEEFKERASVLFEAAVNARVIELTQVNEEEIEARISEAVKAQVEEATVELVENLDEYLDYAVSKWIEENAVALESTFRADLTENFIGDLRDLLERHHVHLEDEKLDIVEELNARIASLEETANETLEENIKLKKDLALHEADEIFASISEGLVPAQADKFSTLAEGVTFEGNLDEYRKKLEIIREQHFGKDKTKKADTGLLSESVDDPTKTKDDRNIVESNEPVDQYAAAISRSVRR